MSPPGAVWWAEGAHVDAMMNAMPFTSRGPETQPAMLVKSSSSTIGELIETSQRGASAAVGSIGRVASAGSNLILPSARRCERSGKALSRARRNSEKNAEDSERASRAAMAAAREWDRLSALVRADDAAGLGRLGNWRSEWCRPAPASASKQTLLHVACEVGSVRVT